MPRSLLCAAGTRKSPWHRLLEVLIGWLKGPRHQHRSSPGTFPSHCSEQREQNETPKNLLAEASPTISQLRAVCRSCGGEVKSPGAFTSSETLKSSPDHILCGTEKGRGGLAVCKGKFPCGEACQHLHEAKRLQRGQAAASELACAAQLLLKVLGRLLCPSPRGCCFPALGFPLLSARERAQEALDESGWPGPLPCTPSPREPSPLLSSCPVEATDLLQKVMERSKQTLGRFELPLPGDPGMCIPRRRGLNTPARLHGHADLDPASGGKTSAQPHPSAEQGRGRGAELAARLSSSPARAARSIALPDSPRASSCQPVLWAGLGNPQQSSLVAETRMRSSCRSCAPGCAPNPWHSQHLSGSNGRGERLAKRLALGERSDSQLLCCVGSRCSSTRNVSPRWERCLHLLPGLPARGSQLQHPRCASPQAAGAEPSLGLAAPAEAVLETNQELGQPEQPSCWGRASCPESEPQAPSPPQSAADRQTDGPVPLSPGCHQLLGEGRTRHG